MCGSSSKSEAEHVQDRLSFTLTQLQNTQEQAADLNDPQLHAKIKTAVDSTSEALNYLTNRLNGG